jgi:hypothetical protein
MQWCARSGSGPEDPLIARAAGVAAPNMPRQKGGASSEGMTSRKLD